MLKPPAFILDGEEPLSMSMDAPVNDAHYRGWVYAWQSPCARTGAQAGWVRLGKLCRCGYTRCDRKRTGECPYPNYKRTLARCGGA